MAQTSNALSANRDADESAKSTKLKPTRILPTERLPVAKQLDLVRAYCVASGFGNKAVRASDMARISKINQTNIYLANPFLVDVGLLQKSEVGFLPSPEAISYTRAYEWNPDTAHQKITPLIELSWFGQALLPIISLRDILENEAIEDLAQATSAVPEYRAQIRMLIEYLEAVGLIQRDGDLLRKGKISRIATVQPESTSQSSGATQESLPQREIQREAQPRSSVRTALSQTEDGVVQFHVSVRVDMSEFATWTPDRISAFFSGIATVLAAKGAVEKEAGKG